MTGRIAVLDLGTNTFHLLIAEVSEGLINRLVDQQQHVKLGEGGINQGYISDAAFSRGIEALKHFASVIAANKVEKIRAVGTSALRSAINGQTFIDKVEEETGLGIEIIDGDLEAELIYFGARQAIEIEGTALIMDIGGGSVEFIICNKKGIFWKKSFPIGAARLMAQFQHTDPISQDELKRLHLHVNEVLQELKEQVHNYSPGSVIGTAGAFETFAALICQKFPREKQPAATGYEFSLHILDTIIKEILRSTHEERRINKAIIPVRTDMIVVAAALTDYVLKELKLPRMAMSSFALKEGLVFSAAGI